jgi:hypothetical protein
MKEFSLESAVMANNARSVYHILLTRYPRNVINKQTEQTVSFLAQHLHNF